MSRSRINLPPGAPLHYPTPTQTEAVRRVDAAIDKSIGDALDAGVDMYLFFGRMFDRIYGMGVERCGVHVVLDRLEIFLRDERVKLLGAPGQRRDN